MTKLPLKPLAPSSGALKLPCRVSRAVKVTATFSASAPSSLLMRKSSVASRRSSQALVSVLNRSGSHRTSTSSMRESPLRGSGTARHQRSRVCEPDGEKSTSDARSFQTRSET
jgi:hypothetical protein